VVPVARRLPELGVVDIGADNLAKASLPVLLLKEVCELVVYVGSLGLEEAGPGAQLVEEEEILFTTKLAVVAFRSLLLKIKPITMLNILYQIICQLINPPESASTPSSVCCPESLFRKCVAATLPRLFPPSRNKSSW
jgi:hypothetical protein